MQRRDNLHIVYIIIYFPDVTTPCGAYIYRKRIAYSHLAMIGSGIRTVCSRIVS